MNQIVSNITDLYQKYPDKLDEDIKLVLMYWRTYNGVRWDSNYISTQDILNKTITPMDQIINAKYILKLLEECD